MGAPQRDKERKAARHTATKLGKTAQRNGGGSGWERVGGKLAHACCKARGGGDARQASQVRGGRRIVKPRRCNTDSHTAACPNESHAGGKVVPLRMQLFPNNPALQLMQELPPEMHFNGRTTVSFSPYIPRAATTTLFLGQGTRVSPDDDTGWNPPQDAALSQGFPFCGQLLNSLSKKCQLKMAGQQAAPLAAFKVFTLLRGLPAFATAVVHHSHLPFCRFKQSLLL